MLAVLGTVVSVSVEVEPFLAPQQGLVAAVSAMSFGVMREGMIELHPDPEESSEEI